mmetsp:Transcript_12219/g.16960  ORF Transcript_12219/g.16960 Transcript_12219/m.16960 type:complete len:82 (+) Transcript_12219:85-330(+)
MFRRACKSSNHALGCRASPGIRCFSSEMRAKLEASVAKTRTMNLFTAINDAMDIALAKDNEVVVFGEDVKFGGVFRCCIGF